MSMTHVFFEGAQDELIFRDYLIANSEILSAYEELKIELKEKCKFDVMLTRMQNVNLLIGF